MISNLKDLFITYEKCPFCNKNLVFKAQYGVVSFLKGHPGFEISIEEDKCKLNFRPEDSKQMSLMNFYFEHLNIDIITNDYSFVEKKDLVMDEKFMNNVLDGNRVVFKMACDCEFKYAVSTNTVKMSSRFGGIISLRVFGEWFKFYLNAQSAVIIKILLSLIHI